MHRRWLPSIPTSKVWCGAYATKWVGWTKAWQREVPSGALWKWNPTSISVLDESDFYLRVGDYCGVYVFLTRHDYVLYVGRSMRLGSRMVNSYSKFPNYQKKHISRFAAHTAPSQVLMKGMELDLLWYYTPPWNTRFHK